MNGKFYLFLYASLFSTNDNRQKAEKIIDKGSDKNHAVKPVQSAAMSRHDIAEVFDVEGAFHQRKAQIPNDRNTGAHNTHQQNAPPDEFCPLRSKQP